MMSAPSNNNNDNNNEGKNNSGGDKQSTISSWFNSLFQHDVRDEIHDKLNIFDDWKEEQERRQKEYEKRMISSSHQQHPFFRGHPFFVDPSPPLPPTNSGNIDAEDFVGSSNTHDHNHNSANDDIHREMQNLLESMVGGAFFPPSSNSRSSTRSSNNNYSSSFDDFFLDNNNIGGGGGNSSSDATTTIVSSSSSSSMNGGLVSSYRMQQDSKNGTQIDIQFQNKNRRKKNDNDDDSTCIHNIAVEVLQERPCVIQWRKSPNNSNSNEKHRKKKNIERDSMMFRRGFGIIPDNHNNNNNNDDSSSSNDNNNVIELGDTIDCSKLSASVSEAENIILTLKAPIRASNNNSTKSLKQPKEDIAGSSRTPRSVPVLPK